MTNITVFKYAQSHNHILTNVLSTCTEGKEVRQAYCKDDGWYREFSPQGTNALQPELPPGALHPGLRPQHKKDVGL